MQTKTSGVPWQWQLIIQFVWNLVMQDLVSLLKITMFAQFIQNTQNFRLKMLIQLQQKRCLMQRVWVILNMKSYQLMTTGEKTQLMQLPNSFVMPASK